MGKFLRYGLVCTLLPLATLGVFVSGCRKVKKPEATTSSREEEDISRPITYQTGLSPESTPTEVANLLIKGLDEENEELLAALAAGKEEARAIEDIFRKHGLSPGKSRGEEARAAAAARLAASGWRATYVFFKKGETRVTGEEIRAEEATVYAEGKKKATLEPGTIIISLIREDGIWKVRAGLHER